ncbi:hypothetical protein ETD86_28715 [Nonomuraea turkmeniaca]|uniref:Uncharacterized protein n=1 Tax=Nonomuraea turkmeniaca TaxID=103838 RepID=A0A5S4FAN9_9ACTN|nr:hypothetical protein [Nonomuraea turkmeniaca]TMR14403.1 hypothetical protein ETD86_28715 [Nonomuraea turkmeniaca]
MTEPSFEATPLPQVWGPGRSWSPGHRVDGQNLDATSDAEMPEWRAWALDGGPTSWPEALDSLEIDRSAVRDVARALLADLEAYTPLRVWPRSEDGYLAGLEEGAEPARLLDMPRFGEFPPGIDLGNFPGGPRNDFNDFANIGAVNHFHDFMVLSLEQFFKSYASYIARLAQSVEEYELAEEASTLSDLEVIQKDDE